MARPALSAEWLSPDFADGRTLEGFAGSLPFLPDLSPALSAMGALGRVAQPTGSAGLRPGSQRPIESTGSVYRREFRPGEKRGLQVGKTKRGKGTKIMAVADGCGLPIALCTASASPNEVTLVRVRPTRCRLGPARCRDVFASPAQPQTSHARRKTLAAVPPPLEDRAPFCLDAKLPPPRSPLRISFR